MTKLFKNFIIFTLFTTLIIIFLSDSSLILNAVNYSLDIFIKNLVPTLFPFFILADILNNYNYLYYLQKIFRFKYSDILIISLFSGLPSNAKYISLLLENKKITEEDASIMLSTSFFPNPMFVITSIGFLMYKNALIGIKMLIIIYISNIILYLFNYKKLRFNNFTNPVTPKPFFSFIKSSILNAMETLLVVLGTIIIFNIVNSVINEYLINNVNLSALISACLEMTSGVYKIYSLNISNNLKYIFTTLTLTFSSLSILFQAFSILENYHINKKIIIKNKIILVLISLILSLIVFCT